MANQWLEHVKRFQRSHPRLSYSDCMVQARKTYKIVKGSGKKSKQSKKDYKIERKSNQREEKAYQRAINERSYMADAIDQSISNDGTTSRDVVRNIVMPYLEVPTMEELYVQYIRLKDRVGEEYKHLFDHNRDMGIQAPNANRFALRMLDDVFKNYPSENVFYRGITNIHADEGKRKALAGKMKRAFQLIDQLPRKYPNFYPQRGEGLSFSKNKVKKLKPSSSTGRY